MQLFQEGFRRPKPFGPETEKLFETLRACGNQLSMNLAWRPSGGVCDGNILALAGVPCIDTLGAVGGNIHTHDEYVELDSLPKRAALAALMLMHFAEKT
ncbi:MAG: M20/M25/M40 family metallo-hydrolase [Parachlamydiaceae bacterium]|nr:M20/M25/M40 family metallo-hydrolase [Parachlamydiaceae bacterium]